jgi:hypothetical protein
MTKAELIAALKHLPEHAEVLVEPLPRDRVWRPPEGELFGIEVEVVKRRPRHAAFAHIRPAMVLPDAPSGY